MNGLLADVRHALRQIVRRPAFGGGAVLMLAVGIGGTTAARAARRMTADIAGRGVLA